MQPDATYEHDGSVPPPAGWSGRASLLFFVRDEHHTRALRDNDSLIVGCLEPATMILDDPTLSPIHARFSLQQGRLTLEDLGSRNGCFVAGRRVVTASLSNGDTVRLGAVEVRISGCFDTPSQDRLVTPMTFQERLANELTRARIGARGVLLLAMEHVAFSALPDSIIKQLEPFGCACRFEPTLTLAFLPREAKEGARRRLHETLRNVEREARAAILACPYLAETAGQLISRILAACRAAPPGEVVEADAAPRGDDQPNSAIALSHCMVKLYEVIERAARTTIPVLIEGETGSGKELVARTLHRRSRPTKPFKAINCATIPTSLIESVLFGYERGAFTGAARTTAGVFEQAHGGTIFLDEIAELSMDAQAALLRVLDQGRVLRVGGTHEIAVDVRVLAASHRALDGMVGAGEFRQDLLYRLNALTVHVPSLRERREEIVPLAELFLAQARARWRVLATDLSEQAKIALFAYGWPGNVRQLRNVIERAAVLCTGTVITLDDLPAQMQLGGPRALSTTETVRVRSKSVPLPERVRDYEISLIREALRESGGKLAKAAAALGIPRRTLAYKIQTMGEKQPIVYTELAGAAGISPSR